MNITTITPAELPSMRLVDKSYLPDDHAVYFVIGSDGAILYIGKAQRLSERWKGTSHHRHGQLSHYGDVRIAWLIVNDVNLLDAIESACIDHFSPILNRTPVEYPVGVKVKKIIILSQDALDKLDALSANSTHKYNKSSVIESLIHQAYSRQLDSWVREELSK